MAEPPVGSNRRRFFAEGLAGLLGKLADYLEGRLELPAPRTWLRPPGAIAEDRFNDVCYRCGTCVELCPANAIIALHAPEEAAHGTPIIDADLAACTICADLLCTRNCPSGALTALDDVHDIRMGVAIVSAGECVRFAGTACTRCTDACPLGARAIRIYGAGPPDVMEPGCVGCGQCQLHCPTAPKAVVVKPF